MIKKRLVFFGPPGSGKGVYGKFLSEALSVPYISVSSLLKKELDEKSKERMSKGELIDDSLVTSVVLDVFSREDYSNGFILDGFPRTLRQAEALVKKVKADYIFNFQADKEVLIERISRRLICPKCGRIYHRKNIRPKREWFCDDCDSELVQRDDDKEEVVLRRLEIYEMKTLPILDYLKEFIPIVDVHINKGFNEIKEQLREKVVSFLSGEIKEISSL